MMTLFYPSRQVGLLLNADNPLTLQLNTYMTLLLSVTSGGAAAERAHPSDDALEPVCDVVLSLTSGGAPAERGQPADAALEQLDAEAPVCGVQLHGPAVRPAARQPTAAPELHHLQGARPAQGTAREEGGGG